MSNAMKVWSIKIEFVGLTGKYVSEFEVLANTHKNAEKKGLLTVGNRDYNSISAVEKFTVSKETSDHVKVLMSMGRTLAQALQEVSK